VTGVPCMKGSGLKWHQDTLGRVHAWDIDRSCEHPVMQVENICHSLGRAGFQTPQLTVFGKIGCLGERFHLEGIANVNNLPKVESETVGGSNPRPSEARKSNALTTTQPCHSVIEHWNATSFLQTTDCLLSSRLTPRTRIRTNVLDSSCQKKFSIPSRYFHSRFRVVDYAGQQQLFVAYDKMFTRI